MINNINDLDFELIKKSVVSSNNLIKSRVYGKYCFFIIERNNFKSFPDYKYNFICVRSTPKGKDSSYKYEYSYVKKTIEDAILSMDNNIKKLKDFDSRRKNEADVKKELNKHITASDFYSIGDIVVSSWGYEQTNVNFYQVVKITNKQIVTLPICSKEVEGTMMSHGMACKVIAVKNSFKKDAKELRFTVKLTERGNQYLAGGDSYRSFDKWDGEPEYCSWYA